MQIHYLCLSLFWIISNATSKTISGFTKILLLLSSTMISLNLSVISPISLSVNPEYAFPIVFGLYFQDDY